MHIICGFPWVRSTLLAPCSCLIFNGDKRKACSRPEKQHSLAQLKARAWTAHHTNSIYLMHLLIYNIICSSLAPNRTKCACKWSLITKTYSPPRFCVFVSVHEKILLTFILFGFYHCHQRSLSFIYNFTSSRIYLPFIFRQAHIWSTYFQCGKRLFQQLKCIMQTIFESIILTLIWIHLAFIISSFHLRRTVSVNASHSKCWRRLSLWLATDGKNWSRKDWWARFIEQAETAAGWMNSWRLEKADQPFTFFWYSMEQQTWLCIRFMVFPPWHQCPNSRWLQFGYNFP